MLDRGGILEGVRVLEDVIPSGLEDPRNPLHFPADTLYGAVQQQIQLVHPAHGDVGSVHPQPGRLQVRVAPGRGGEGLDAGHPQLLVRLQEGHDLAAVVIHRRRASLLAEVDEALLEGQDVALVGLRAHEPPGDVPPDDQHVGPRLLHGLRGVQHPLHGEAQQPFVEWRVGKVQGVEIGEVVDQRRLVEGPAGGPDSDDAVLPHRSLEPIHPGLEPLPERRLAGGLVAHGDLQVFRAADRLAGAGVHALPVGKLVDRVVLAKGPAGSADARA